MTAADQFITALCLYREARGQGILGMTAVAGVIQNRMAKHGSSAYTVVTKPLQFSSMTAHGDPQLGTFPAVSESSWVAAQRIVTDMAAGDLKDVTGGSTCYYDSSISFPAHWDKSKVQLTRQIGRFYFFRETA